MAVVGFVFDILTFSCCFVAVFNRLPPNSWQFRLGTWVSFGSLVWRYRNYSITPKTFANWINYCALFGWMSEISVWQSVSRWLGASECVRVQGDIDKFIVREGGACASPCDCWTTKTVQIKRNVMTEIRRANVVIVVDSDARFHFICPFHLRHVCAYIYNFDCCLMRESYYREFYSIWFCVLTPAAPLNDSQSIRWLISDCCSWNIFYFFGWGEQSDIAPINLNRF